MSTLEYFSTYMGATGLGALIGIIISHFLEKDRRKQLMILEAKRTIYPKALTTIQMIYPSVDTNIIQIEKRKKILNEVKLLSDNELNNFITDFYITLDILKKLTIERKTNGFYDSLLTLLSNLDGNIEQSMRKELGLKSKIVKLKNYDQMIKEIYKYRTKYHV